MVLMHLCLRLETCSTSLIPLLTPGFPQESLGREDAAAQPPPAGAHLQPCPASDSIRIQWVTQPSLALAENSATKALDAMELKELLGFSCSRTGAAFPAPP